MGTDPDAAKLAGLLADEVRLAVVAALALGAADIDGVAAATGRTPTEVALAARRLGRGGLVRRDGAALQLRTEVFAAAARAAGSTGRPRSRCRRTRRPTRSCSPSCARAG
ncbi:hypothetical protein ACFQX8_15050 [Klenkia terrae]|uniref:hypothetical protein n=1 Tax=Klenkia terrae TaxID=1052259 RepID=UPI0036137FFD